MDNSLQISRAPVIVHAIGATVKERKASIMENAAPSVCFALANAKGDVGKMARAGIADVGRSDMARRAAFPRCDYRPVATYLAAQLGEGLVVSNRASFESLPDMLETRLMKIKAAKNGGYRTNKDGIDVETAAHTLVRTLKGEIVEIIAEARALSIEAKAKMEAEKAAQQALLANDPTIVAA